MKKIITIVFLLSTSLTFGQIKNGSFEMWDSVYTNTYSADLTSLFGVPNPIGGIINNWTFDYGYGISRTTDSYSGNYSLILHNWYSYAYSGITYHDSLSYRPQYLQGYFKYISGGVNGVSQGSAKVTLTKFNGTANDTIAAGAYQFDSTVSFSSFQIAFNYISALNPDSININFINGNHYCGGGGSYMVCNLLYLDNITLSSSPLGISTINSTDNLVSVFPNPSSNELTIQNNAALPFQFILYNSLGEKCSDKIVSGKTNSIDLSAYSDGIYYYKFISANGIIKTGKIMKQ